MGTEIIVRIMTLDEQDSPLLLKTPPPPPRLFQTIRILLAARREAGGISTESPLGHCGTTTIASSDIAASFINAYAAY